MYLAQNLKYLREQKGMSQADIADLLGNIGQRAVSKWEAGESEPSLDTIIQLSEYFSVTLDDLILYDLKPPIPYYVTNLKFLRKRRNLTQEDMAKFLGFKGKQGYNSIENGKVKPNIENLEKLADYFSVTLDELVKQDLSKGGS